MKTLIVIDMQNDFITGSLANEAAQKIVPNIVKYMKDNQSEISKVIFTRDTHGPGYLQTTEGKKLPIMHCLKYTEGWNVNAEIINAAVELFGPNSIQLINKNNFGYDNWLVEDVEAEVVFMGTCTDSCVVSNVLIFKAAYSSVEISVIADCCAGLTKEKHEAALEVMRSCQIEVI